MQDLIRDSFWYAAGLLYLALARAKYMLTGYSTPKPFGFEEMDRCIEYDIDVARLYLDALAAHTGRGIDGMRVLELGPGSDLGVGLCLIAKGAASYTAIDRNPLAENVPGEFYEKLRKRIGISNPAEQPRYIVDETFNVQSAGGPFDLVLSNAAFEHFDDPPAVVNGLSDITSPGALALVFVDLQTHSRWVRTRDPNNIYRYPEWLYRLFYFPGQPNRVRPPEYERIFKDWRVNISPSTTIVSPKRLARQFRTAEARMDWTTISIFGKRQQQVAELIPRPSKT